MAPKTLVRSATKTFKDKKETSKERSTVKESKKEEKV
jgi:hypothetical protein